MTGVASGHFRCAASGAGAGAGLGDGEILQSLHQRPREDVQGFRHQRVSLRGVAEVYVQRQSFR